VIRHRFVRATGCTCSHATTLLFTSVHEEAAVSPTEFMPGDIVRTNYAQVGEVLTVGAALVCVLVAATEVYAYQPGQLEVIA
jgi:hypothetical protein